MAHPHTQSATPINKRERSSRGAPHGLNEGLRAFAGQAGVIAVVCASLGFLATWFMIQSRPVQAMIIYFAIVVGCALLAVAGLRRKANDR